MTTFDFAPLFRTAIGFDRLARLMDTAASTAEAPSYPPYNIEKTGDDTYRLTMAVAGFSPDGPRPHGEGQHAGDLRPRRRRGAEGVRCCIAASPAARSSAGSCSPTTSWSRAPT